MTREMSGIVRRVQALMLTALALAAVAAPAAAQVTGDVPAARPDAIVDLATREGARFVNGEWRYSDTRIVDVDHRAVGADLKASGAPTRAYDIEPHAGGAAYDDRAWEVLDPTRLDARRSKGRLAFNWYRINVTIPAKVAAFDTHRLQRDLVIGRGRLGSIPRNARKWLAGIEDDLAGFNPDRTVAAKLRRLPAPKRLAIEQRLPA